VLATDRSISSVMMISVIGRAMSRIGAISRMRYVSVSGLSKFGTVTVAITITRASRPMMAASRFTTTRRHSGCWYALYSRAGFCVRTVTVLMTSLPPSLR